jgi:tRNA/tmRNA/rRNA uracil-C5-methylase (TrmA/RlmC/RlmD family)
MATAGGDEVLDLQVGGIAGGGGCVGRAPDGKVVFVRHSLPGERVLARVTAATNSYLRADAVEVLDASPDRVEPPCPHAGPGRCGGCDFQHVELGAQRKLKKARIEELLRQIAGVSREVVVEAVEGDHGGLRWRTRVRLAVDRNGQAGFRRHRSHRLEPVGACPIATPEVEATGALQARWPGAAELEVITAAATSGANETASVVSVTPRGHAQARLPALNAGMVVKGKVRRDPGSVLMTAGSRTYRVSAGVFWQAHCGAPEALLAAVLAGVGDCQGASIVDLYAGAGLFAAALAQRTGPGSTVLAVERDPRACGDLRHNAADLPHLLVDEAEVSPELVATGIGRPSVVVLDPAREGAGLAVMRALAGLAPTLRRVVYVSCDAASFSRDARVLLDERWTLTSLRAFDIFPMTEHVELVGSFELST